MGSEWDKERVVGEESAVVTAVLEVDVGVEAAIGLVLAEGGLDRKSRWERSGSGGPKEIR